MRLESKDHEAPPRWLAGITLIVTNLIKVGGLGAAVDQMFFKPSAQPVILAVAAFMMAGAQGIEEAALHFIGRFFGMPEKPPPTRRRTRR